ncbi:hypothetical protein [Hyphomonas pacifica]|uniref:Uncharacterized protein n=1 Tax=Hyphomonas pacifica TaxID=1280941 RepID=A0A062U5A1_9PROT|nr:hypothetical protein [Hyphomonas pacifica]KCZ51315.1 hypothetical protein HY2_11680 [Hyphomonas pacifica]RAN33977.1 hypothetical protein HY3_11795 [Hyphomonas pacifica]RAN36606.1 hypothetical protein HY11_11715 [Hyphomonas pacifica]
MLTEITAHLATHNGLSQETAKRALGIVLNAAERQESPFALAMFKTIPGARALSARIGSDIGAPTGTIARMIEQTPGGKRLVAQSMISELHGLGLDHKAIGQLLPAISSYMEQYHGLTGFGHLGDLIGSDLDAEAAAAQAA